MLVQFPGYPVQLARVFAFKVSSGIFQTLVYICSPITQPPRQNVRGSDFNR